MKKIYVGIDINYIPHVFDPVTKTYHSPSAEEAIEIIQRMAKEIDELRETIICAGKLPIIKISDQSDVPSDEEGVE